MPATVIASNKSRGNFFLFSHRWRRDGDVLGKRVRFRSPRGGSPSLAHSEIIIWTTGLKFELVRLRNPN